MKDKYRKLRNMREAKKLWANGETIYLLGCNLLPGMMWHPCPVKMKDYVGSALRFKALHDEVKSGSSSYYARQYAHLWSGTLEETTWNLMYNNWKYYNTSYEEGYYAHYYVKG